MKLKSLLTVLVTVIALSAFSQDKKEFGKCSINELKLTQCDFDTAAEAMVLYDIATISYQEPAGYMLERKIKIKIFTKAGFDAGNFSFTYVKGNNISQIKGNTYNFVDGKIVKTPLNTKTVYDEKLLNDIYAKKIAMPDIREGSVIEISYRRNDISFWRVPSWKFQGDIPVLYSEYNFIEFPLFEYKHKVSGEYQLDSYTNEEINSVPISLWGRRYYSRNRKYIMTEVPAFRDQSFITCTDDYITKVDFQLTGVRKSDGTFESKLSTWTKVCETLNDHENFGSYIKSAEREGRKLFEFLPNTTALEKAKWVDSYLKKNFTYNGSTTYVTSDDFKKINESKRGNAADLNLIAIGMLKAAGLNVTPVLLSTREHGKVALGYPFLDAFNYVAGVLFIEDNYYLIDVTEPLLKFGDVPTRCFNDQGLLVQNKIEEWIDIASTQTSDMKHIITIDVNPQHDSLIIDCQITATNYEAHSRRIRYKEEYEKLAKYYFDKDYTPADSLRCKNLNDPEQPFEMSYVRTTEAETVDNHLMIDPFAGLVPTESPLRQPTRVYPIDFTFKWSRTFSTTINIPEGYKLSTKPDNLIINDKNIRVVYTVTEKEPNQINVIGIYQFKKDIYQPAEYDALRGYYDQIISRFNQKITLEAVGI